MPPVKGKKARRPNGARDGERRCFGSHLSIAGGMHHAIEEALRLGFSTVQVFVKNQRQWRATPLASDAVEQWHALLDTPGFGPPVAHATYLINLAADDPALFARSRDAFAEELVRCQQLSIPYLVVHPGAAGDASTSDALSRVSRGLNEIFEALPELKTMPLLETTAGQGSSLGRSFDELAAIIDGVREPRRVGVCIDTCHVFAAGYDIRTGDNYDLMMKFVERSIGLDKVRCLHLNDSKRELGSRVDRHEHIGEGCIGADGFRNVLNDPRLAKLPMILETPKGVDDQGVDLDTRNLRRLKRLIRPRA